MPLFIEGSGSIERNKDRDLMEVRFMYLKMVGTPYPVGERLMIDGKPKEIVGYEFGTGLNLDILLDDGTVVTEEIGKTDKIRDKYIRKFLERARSDSEPARSSHVSA